MINIILINLLLFDSKEKLDNRDIKRCPATKLADKRTDNVIGRIIFLIISIITIKFISWLGVPIGVRWIIIFLKDFNHPHNIIDNHKIKEIEKLIEIWAVGVKLKGNNAIKLTTITIMNKFVIIIEEKCLFIIIIWFICFSINFNIYDNDFLIFSLCLKRKILIKMIGRNKIVHLKDKYEDEGSNMLNMFFIIVNLLIGF